MGGGGLLDIGFYPITMARFIFEAEPVRVMGLLEIDPRFGVDRLASAILEFPRGHAIFTCSTQLAPYQNLDILGTRGRIGVEIPWSMPDERPSRLIVDDGARSAGQAAQKGVDEIWFPACDQWGVHCDRFCEAIAKGQPAPVPIEDAVANMRVIDAVFRAAQSGRWQSALAPLAFFPSRTYTKSCFRATPSTRISFASLSVGMLAPIAYLGPAQVARWRDVQRRDADKEMRFAAESLARAIDQALDISVRELTTMANQIGVVRFGSTSISAPLLHEHCTAFPSCLGVFVSRPDGYPITGDPSHPSRAGLATVNTTKRCCARSEPHSRASSSEGSPRCRRIHVCAPIWSSSDVGHADLAGGRGRRAWAGLSAGADNQVGRCVWRHASARARRAHARRRGLQSTEPAWLDRLSGD